MSDLFGRRYVALAGATLLIVGVIIMSTAKTMNNFICGSVLTGAGAAINELTAVSAFWRIFHSFIKPALLAFLKEPLLSVSSTLQTTNIPPAGGNFRTCTHPEARHLRLGPDSDYYPLCSVSFVRAVDSYTCKLAMGGPILCSLGFRWTVRHSILLFSTTPRQFAWSHAAGDYQPDRFCRRATKHWWYHMLPDGPSM